MRRDTEAAILRVAEALAWRRWIGPASSTVFLLAYALIPVGAVASISFVGCVAEVALYVRALVRTVGGAPTRAQLRRAELWSLGAWGALALASVGAAPLGADRLLLMLGATVVLLAQRRHRGRFGRAALASLRAQEASVLTVARGVLGVRELTAREVEAGERDDLAVRAYPDGAMAVSVPAHVLLVHADEPKVADRFEAAGWELDRIDYDDRLMWLRRPAYVEPLPTLVSLDLRELPRGRVFLLGIVRGEDGGVRWAVWDPDAADPHLLMVGRTKTGKSVVLTVLLAQAVARGWRTYVLDPKGSDYVWTRNLPGTSWHPAERSQDGLTAAFEEMIRRRKVLDAIQQTHDEVRNFTEAIEAGMLDPADEPPCLVIVDEMAELVELGDKDQNKAATVMLGRLARLARFVDMFLVVATQRPDATLLPGEVKSNLGTRGVTGPGDSIALRMAFDTDEVEPLAVDPETGKLPKGRGRFTVGAGEPVEIQFAYVSPADVKAFVGADSAPAAEPATAPEPAPAADPGIERMFAELDEFRGQRTPPGEDEGVELSLEDDDEQAQA